PTRRNGEVPEIEARAPRGHTLPDHIPEAVDANDSHTIDRHLVGANGDCPAVHIPGSQKAIAIVPQGLKELDVAIGGGRVLSGKRDGIRLSPVGWTALYGNDVPSSPQCMTVPPVELYGFNGIVVLVGAADQSPVIQAAPDDGGEFPHVGKFRHTTDGEMLGAEDQIVGDELLREVVRHIFIDLAPVALDEDRNPVDLDGWGIDAPVVRHFPSCY